jgi:RNA 2',3'-cyclic 3'-phosphodiesterase
VRLFVGVWPSAQVRSALAALPRPEVAGLRWTTEDQWHVTLAFVGEVTGEHLADVECALDTAARHAAAAAAALGPATVRLGRTLLCVPVEGLEEMAGSARAALGAAGVPMPDADHPFRGHCTLARARRGRVVPPSLAGAPVAASWAVTRLCLVRSTLDPAGARYETLRTATVSS